MGKQRADAVREVVRHAYSAMAKERVKGGCCSQSPCCSPELGASPTDSARLGYSADEIAAVPEGADMGMGCGNPGAIAALKPGETVLDLGCGGGFDCFLAAQRVGKDGRVIGVDMTTEMISAARRNAAAGSYANVEFRLGEIEALPVADNSVDVIISNCVINLSPEKPRVYREAYRALKPGGRLAISDVVATAELPAELRSDTALLSGCVAGAESPQALEAMLREAGFQEIRIQVNEASRAFIAEWAPGLHLDRYLASATIEAVKPGRERIRAGEA